MRIRNRFIGLALLCAAAAGFMPSNANAQLNRAYDYGFKPLRDLTSRLNDLVSSTSKQDDHSSVRDLGRSFSDTLDYLIAGLEAIGKNFRDSDNQSWANSVRSKVLSDAKNAKYAAAELRSCGDNNRNSLAAAKALQVQLTDLSDDFRACLNEHENRRKDLFEKYESTRLQWWASTKDDRRPVDDAARNVDSLRERLNDKQARSQAATRLYLTAHDQCDRARSELFNADRTRTTDDVRRRYDEWTKAEDLVKRAGEVATYAEREASDAARAYNDAFEQWRRASENYMKEAAEGNLLYQLVIQRHARLYELSQEYTTFSF